MVIGSNSQWEKIKKCSLLKPHGLPEGYKSTLFEWSGPQREVRSEEKISINVDFSQCNHSHTSIVLFLALCVYTI